MKTMFEIWQSQKERVILSNKRFIPTFHLKIHTIKEKRRQNMIFKFCYFFEVFCFIDMKRWISVSTL